MGAEKLLPGRKGLEILEFIEKTSGCEIAEIYRELGKEDKRLPRSLTMWRTIQQVGIADILFFLEHAELVSWAELQYTITNKGKEFLSSHKRDRKKPPRLSSERTREDKDFNRELGGGCPICKQGNTLWVDWPGSEYAICQNCGAEFAWHYPRALIVYLGGKYLHKQLMKDGWKIVREGKEPFLCPGCGSQPKDLRKDWKGRFKPGTTKKLRCDCCGRDLKVDGNEIAEDLTVDIAKSPKYEAIVEVATNFIWPARCCICLGVPVIWTPLEIMGVATDRDFVANLKQTINVPYCQACLNKEGKSPKGVWARSLVEAASIIPLSYRQRGLVAKFRNSEYARMFRELNPLVHLEYSGHPWPPQSETSQK